MISTRDDCTCIVATYFAESLSTLPTRAANDGRSLAPGGGCITSAPTYKQSQRVCRERPYTDIPITTVGFDGSVKIETERGSGIEFFPPSLTFSLVDVRRRQRRTEESDVLKTYVREVLLPRLEALRGLHALRNNSHLRYKSGTPSRRRHRKDIQRNPRS